MFRRSIHFFSKTIKSPAFAVTQDAFGKSLKESKELDMVFPDGDLTMKISHGNKINVNSFRWNEKTKRYISGKSLADLAEEMRFKK